MTGSPRRKPNRLRGYDYSTPGTYFITVCSKNMDWIFWNVGASIARPGSTSHYSLIGQVIDEMIAEIPMRYPEISVDSYVIMPNHIHLLLTSCPEDNRRAMLAPTPDISVVVQQLKGAVTKKAGLPIWQKGFHDHVVRNEKSYWKIYEYIENNPLKWELDSLNVWRNNNG